MLTGPQGFSNPTYVETNLEPNRQPSRTIVFAEPAIMEASSTDRGLPAYSASGRDDKLWNEEMATALEHALPARRFIGTNPFDPANCGDEDLYSEEEGDGPAKDPVYSLAHSRVRRAPSADAAKEPAPTATAAALSTPPPLMERQYSQRRGDAFERVAENGDEPTTDISSLSDSPQRQFEEDPILLNTSNIHLLNGSP